MFKMFRNETKSEKKEKVSNISTAVNTKANGNSFTTSVTQNKTMSYTAASHATTTQVVHNSSLRSSNEPNGIYSFNGNTYLDQVRYKGAPPRSAFTSTPLTTKPLPIGSKSFIDAKPITVPHPIVKTAAKAPVQNSLLNSNIQSSSAMESELRVKLQIKVKESKVFCDNNHKSVIPVYKTRSKHRGKLLLINNIQYVNNKEVRKGAELDETNVGELFKQIGFQIIKSRNLSKKEMEAKVTAFRKDKTLSKVDIAAVIIMSHGTGQERSDSTEIACTDGNLLPTTWIINQFDSTLCPQLEGKAKIFIFQCCRGDQWDIQNIQYDGIPTNISRKLSDMLIAYATIPGFVAHRDPLHGTWYIQAICKVFMEHAHDTDVENLLKIVDTKLSTLITDYGSKQTTSFENRGFKTCYLHPKLFEK